MSINYTSVIGVGVMEDEIAYSTLTEQSKNIVKEIIRDYDLDVSEEDMNDWFSDNIWEYDIFDVLGLNENTGNCFSGETGYRGVSVDLSNIEKSKEDFKKIVNLEPEVFNGVLVWWICCTLNLGVCMKIEDVEVGMEVEIVSTLYTDDQLCYCENDMLSVGECGEVISVDYNDNSVQLSDGTWFSVRDLEPCTESRENTNIGNLTVSISLEDKQEIAKDILKIVLKDFNKVISDTIAQLDDDDSEDWVVEIKQAENVLSQFTDQKMIEIVEQAPKEVFKKLSLNKWLLSRRELCYLKII